MDTLPNPSPFAGFPIEFNRLVKRCRDRGIDFAGMQSASAVEMSLGDGGFESASSRLAGDEEIVRLEGPIQAKPLPRTVRSNLRYFLDGAQQTLPAGRLGHVPVYLSLTVAGILERDERGECSLKPGTLRLQNCWIVPEGIDTEASRFLCDNLRGIGGTVVDPLKRHYEDPAVYRRAACDYIQIEKRALQATNDQRSQLEEDLLADWAQSRHGNDGWIVVDGQLRLPVPNAVGLVKSFTYQYFTGEEATALYSLPPGQRSSAFKSSSQYRARAGGTLERTLWYLRFHNADGLDARHGLIRLEAAPEFIEPERIDELSAWLLAERAPRATADARWDSLIYPIHLLERMLKNRVAHETRSWPGARR
jgi:hypothetical protein